LSSVDHAITDEARQKREAEAELAAIFDGSRIVALAERVDSLTSTARISDLEDLRAALARLRAAPREAPTQ
jgi:MFS transporter, NNP family, nitrate/nitrite transporter